jgi:hypothetical protein
MNKNDSDLIFIKLLLFIMILLHIKILLHSKITVNQIVIKLYYKKDFIDKNLLIKKSLYQTGILYYYYNIIIKSNE